MPNKIILIFILSASSFAVSWDLKIVYPDREKKEYELPEKEFSPVIKGTSYKCVFGKTEPFNSFKFRSINCFDMKSNHSIFSGLGCSAKNRDQSQLDFSFTDGKNKSYSIQLKCRN